MKVSVSNYGSRVVYKKVSLVKRIAKKIHLKEVALGVLGFVSIYCFTILCFACCQY